MTARALFSQKLPTLALALGLAATALLGSSSTAQAAVLDCDVIEVLELYNGRVHARCNNSIVLNGATIRFIAVATSDTQRANRFLQLATSALLAGKPLRADLPSASTTNAPGCAASDCRTPDTFGVAY